MQIVRAVDYRRMAWKNGGGETAEVMIFPEGAALDAFDWRISMARVEVDGPFSAFAGVDRNLSILVGAGLRLSVAGRAAVELTGASEPYAFAGDEPAGAVLLDRAVTDLNVMTRRHRFLSRVRRGKGTESLPCTAAVTCIVCAAGELHLQAGEQTATLGALDASLSVAGPEPVAVDAGPDARYLVVEIVRS